MGTPEFAVPSLEGFYSNHDVVAVFTQSQKPAGRGMKLKKTPIHLKAEKLGLPVYTPNNLLKNDIHLLLKSFDLDFIIVVAYGLILPKQILNIPKFIPINGHASLLPKWRGSAPIQRAIEAGESVTGSTAMLMETGLDSGPILLQKKLNILTNDDSISIHRKLSYLTADCLLHAVDKYQKGKIDPKTQNPLQVSYANKLAKEEGLIDWSISSFEIFNKLRAFQPFPGLYTIMNGFNIKVIDGTPLKLIHNQKEGTVLETKLKLIIACGNNTAFSILKLQKPGKNKLSYSEFLKGTKIEKGYIFE